MAFWQKYINVIVGAHFYDNGEADEGRAYVYHGNGGSGLSLIPVQRKSDNSAPIAPFRNQSGIILEFFYNFCNAPSHFHINKF